MRIAQIAPLHEAVPPKLYGGTERVVSYLTEELVAQGHEVTLFASGDSITSARLEPIWPQALRLSPALSRYYRPSRPAYGDRQKTGGQVRRDAFPCRLLAVQLVQPSAHTVRDDAAWAPRPGRAEAGVQRLSPCAGRVDLGRAAPAAAAGALCGTVYHGLPEHLLTPVRRGRDYLAFLGRIAPEKGPDQAIRIARGCGIPLKIAAKVDRVGPGLLRRRHPADAG